MTLQQAIAQYLINIEAKSGRTASAYSFTLAQFLTAIGDQPLDSIKQQDLLTFAASLRPLKLADRTIHNKVAEVITMLRSFGRKDVTLHVRYTQKRVSAYTREELKRFFAACDPEEKLLYNFFLLSGCREGEVSHACWCDLNFEDKTFAVREHKEIGFIPKDREERYIPLPDSLLDALKARRVERPNGDLIFPSRNGRPEGHFLRRLKDIVKRAGIPGKWELHKFRKSFASIHHDSGVSARTLQTWLGHSNLETTLAYLEASDYRSERVRGQVNNTFAAIA